VAIPYTVVYIEDNLGDILLLKQAFEERGFAVQVNAIDDWDEAIRYLRVKDTARDAPPPDLFLLDQQLPRGDGKHLMEFIAESEYLREIPAYLFSSPPLSDRLRAQFLADRILDKPATWEGYLELVDRFMRDIEAFRASRGLVQH
jgi:CheY-like chemotaxis protein